MCGRFSLAADPQELQMAFPGFLFPNTISPRYNVAPSQPVLAIPNNGNKKADFFRWGLIPSWAKDPSIGMKMINARSEGISEKPSFRGPYRYKRCIVPVSGFYEWKKNPASKTKTPYYIGLSSGAPFGIAGLWDEWLSSDGSEVQTCTLITTSSNSLISPLHERMPVILPPDAYNLWLDPEPIKPGALNELLIPYASDKMAAYPVTPFVNNVANDSPLCVQAAN